MRGGGYVQVRVRGSFMCSSRGVVANAQDSERAG